MDSFATQIIKTLGGTTAVARMLQAPVSTVHSWTKDGIPPSRLAHLKLAAHAEKFKIDWDTGLAITGQSESRAA